MKKTFTKEYMNNNKGCYDNDKLNACSFMSKSEIDILDILNSEIKLKDKGWFLIRKCELTLDQKKQLAYDLALVVLPIYEKKYPDDKRVRECLEAILKFKNGEIDRNELLEKRRAAAAAAYAAYAAAAADYAYAAADAAYAAAAAYAADAAAGFAADAAAYAYDAAAYAADADAYKILVLQCMIDFVNKQD